MPVDEPGTQEGLHPLLFLHGGGVAGWMWHPVVESLEADFQVMAPDLPGHGPSAAGAYRTHQETTAALVLLLEKHAPRGATVVGFSLGAQLALLLAATRPDLVLHLIVVSAQAKPTPLPRVVLGLLALTAPLARQCWFAKLQAKELFVPDALVGHYIAGSAQISRDTLLGAVGENIRFNPPDQLRSFTRPALILVGGKERAMMRDSAKIIHAALPNSELEIVEGCGHGIPLQRPDWFSARLRGWVLASGDEGAH